MTGGIDADRSVFGMIHLQALPGAPGFDGDREAIRDAMLRDARRLEAAGVDGLMIENFGDAPFYAEDVPKHVVASMTSYVSDLRRETDLPIGVNVLRNDAEAALSIAAAAEASLVRINVHTSARLTDQGVVTGNAPETIRLRDRLEADVSILADVDVKHSAPLAERPLPEEVAELVERGHADGVVASGAGTGHETDRDHLEAVVDARDDLDRDVPVFVGSGVRRDTVAETLDVADGVIVGTDLKESGETTAPVDEDRARELVAAARAD
ncbi:photosystem I assembly BtpA protein [Halorhabdus tiamatea SARL4B]|uniref:BtpA family protein n=1 Tax=Halorhabdus tiamatea SARL4B TaxID=1033806 RepID=F7PFT9_9EURY|nr:BtpA/SgcQ family protein [Halorhabdus tiamatea]ERJ04898.1 photosystem I assembly BtpA protein [Halorhabdus tiamatea SARL4B]CCQ33203.1 BtpA family protein [Halorhabdus tiamatea SARL4B]